MMNFMESTFECVRDGLTIRGTEYRPAGENLPVAVLCHGFMANQNRMSHYAKVFAEEGYAAYCFDFCGGSIPGTGKSDGETEKMSVLTEMEDLMSVIDYAQNLTYNSKELILMGNSQGGFVAGMTSAKYAGLVDKLIMFYPALCIPDDARAGQMRAGKFDPDHIPDTFECGPMLLGRCYPEAVNRMDAIEEIKGYEGPVLLVHGTADDIVSIEYSKKADRAFKDSELIVIEGGKHGFSAEHDEIAIEAVRKFIRR